MRDSFVFYRSFFEALNGLPFEEKGKCYTALADYALNSVIPDNMEPVAKIFFTMARPQIDANIQRHENGCKGAKFGHLGGRPRKNPEETPNKPQASPSSTPNENLNDNLNDNVKKVSPEGDKHQIDVEEYIEEQKNKRFIKPTIEEIKIYCQEKNKNVDANRFWNFYESKGWKVGRSPMKDWKAAICNWSKEDTYIQTNYISHKDNEEIKKLASSAELTKQKLMEQAKNKFGV